MLTPYIGLPRAACIAEARELDAKSAAGTAAAGFDHASLRPAFFFSFPIFFFPYLDWLNLGEAQCLLSKHFCCLGIGCLRGIGK